MDVKFRGGINIMGIGNIFNPKKIRNKTDLEHRFEQPNNLINVQKL